MVYSTLISAADLRPHLGEADWAVVDCRFALNEPERGRHDYLAAHIPGAVYAHLTEDLSGPVVPGQTGRHPLPEVDRFAQVLAGWGIDARVQVVAYDASGGSMAAARLWWMLHWLGHEAAAVLDGGWPAWQAAGYPEASGPEHRTPRTFTPHVHSELVLSSAEVAARLHDPRTRLLDVRAAARYRGEQEPIDPVAGHIPGAASAPYEDTLDTAGRFRAPEELRARFQGLLGAAPPEGAVAYCGSGVTAAHTLLALTHAGLGPGRLYAGSWSEWITDPARPIATGEEPQGGA
ncbi:MAG TPA: sulfurtransferase [Chloroflexia bacterium]